MARQPFLPTYAANPSYLIGPGAIDDRPEFTALIGQCMAMWSEAELQMALILGALMKADNDAAVGVYLSLRNSRTRRDVLQAAADAVLPSEARMIFAALLTISKSVESLRNDLTHGIWGISDDIPDAVLWTTLAAHSHFLIEVYKNEANGVRSLDPHARLKKELFVYKKTDLEFVYSEISFLQNIAFKFHVSVREPEISASGYNQLCSEPRIQRELARLRAGQKNTP